jgi:hypothetical protein
MSLFLVPIDVIRHHICRGIKFKTGYEILRFKLSILHTCKKFRTIWDIESIFWESGKHKSIKLLNEKLLRPYFIGYLRQIATPLFYPRSSIAEEYTTFVVTHANMESLDVLWCQWYKNGGFPGSGIDALISRNDLIIAKWIYEKRLSNSCKDEYKLCEKAARVDSDIALGYFMSLRKETIIKKINKLIKIATQNNSHKVLNWFIRYGFTKPINSNRFQWALRAIA